MNKDLKNIINQFIDDENTLNKILVSIFINSNSLKVKNNKLINDLILSNESPHYHHIVFASNKLSFDELIESFELAIPSQDKVVNGAVYTPNYIKTFIVENSISKVKKPLAEIKSADISCGCGAFLFTIANKLKKDTQRSFREIFEENIFGLDICPTSIKRTEILLSLLAISQGEDEEEFKFNLFCGNALSFEWKSNCIPITSNEGFDLIVGNPPYVRAKNIDLETKKLLTNWSVTKSGNPDLYIPFFEIGLENLNKNGILGYITVNSFFKSVNARELRKYLQTNRYELSIIDFGDEKLFESKSAYTCICFLAKEKSEYLLFKKETSKNLEKNGLQKLNKIPFKDLDFQRGWIINQKQIVENIKRIESAGESLGAKYKIKNGIATLSNDIYIFKPIAENKNYYTLIRNGKKFEIEKGICRDIIKPNILKYEHEIESIKEKLIYPYTNGITPLTLMNEEQLKSNFPKTYEYLLFHKDELQKRDKGNGDYGAWYAFGRTQALTDKGYKLLFPYMAKDPHFVFTDQKDMMIYCGYAIFNESVEELKILKRILESKVFDYYMQNTSKPYSSGYLSYAKNYVKNFGVCELTENDRYFLSNGATKDEVDDFLIAKYKIQIE
jgi:adenine-specific DNA-methyltransferase